MSDKNNIQNNENNTKENDQEILSIPAGNSININDSGQIKKSLCDFIIKEKIGEGTFSTVKLAINKQTEEKAAIKILEKKKIIQKEDKIRLEREIEVLKKLRHPNLVHLYSVIETKDKIYLIMEYIKGMELFDYIVMKKKLSEIEACMFFQQLISGIEYLHKIKYIHRDIKPENLLIKENNKELTIVDFGLTNIYINTDNNLLSSACGSPSYAAPEMLNSEKYKGPPVDIWSCGIVLYAMLCGYLPFEDENNNNDILYDKICKGKYIIPNHVSEKARDLLNKILTTDPKRRLNIYQIKNHPWFSIYNEKGKLLVNNGLILTKYIIPVDEEIVDLMFKKFNINKEEIRISILSNNHDDISTLYYLFLIKKIKSKKKSEADIKSILFKKYCESKNNLMKTYNNDINIVIKERKTGNIKNMENSEKKKINKEDNLSEKKRLSKKLKRYFSPEEKIKTFNLNRKFNETEANINKNYENSFNFNKYDAFSKTESNYKDEGKMEYNHYDINQGIKKRNKLHELKGKKINMRGISHKEKLFITPNKDKFNITNRTVYLEPKIKNQNGRNEKIMNKKYITNSKLNYFSEDISSLEKRKFMKIIYENKKSGDKNSLEKNKLTHFFERNGKHKKVYDNNCRIKKFFSYLNKTQFTEDFNHSINHIRKKKFISIMLTETLKKNKINDDSCLNSKETFYCCQPFDLALIYFKPKKLLEEKLISLLEQSKIKYRLINKKKYIIELKKENISISLNFDKLKDINEEKEGKTNSKMLSIINLKRINGGYENNLKPIKKIIYNIK